MESLNTPMPTQDELDEDYEVISNMTDTNAEAKAVFNQYIGYLRMGMPELEAFNTATKGACNEH